MTDLPSPTAQTDAVQTRPIPSSILGRADIGPISIMLLVIAYAVLWVVARPAEEPIAAWLGEAFGAEAVLLFAVALVLISTRPWIESWFHGYDHAAIWHRRAAIVGLVLLLPHFALSSNPDATQVGAALAALSAAGMFILGIWSIIPRWRAIIPKPFHGIIRAVRETAVMNAVRSILGGYNRWRALHQTIGIFAIAGFAHGLLDALTFQNSSLMEWSYVAVAGVGTLAYAYRELLADHVVPTHSYQVDSVRTIDSGLTEVVLSPVGAPLPFAPGQFAIVSFETKEGWQRHPFTISSSNREGVIRLTIKALGDFTSSLDTTLQRGMPAIIEGPHGRFNYRNGTKRQVWVASGVGITPFLSWIRSLNSEFDFEVDFFYSARGEAPFTDEILAVAQRHPSLRVHLIDTGKQGRLTPEQVLQVAGPPVSDLSVYMCGPEPMLEQFTEAFQEAGVPRAFIHREYFNWR